MGPENNVGLEGCWILECLLPYLCMVTVPHIMVGLERILDYRGFAFKETKKLPKSNNIGGHRNYVRGRLNRTLLTNGNNYLANAW